MNGRPWPIMRTSMSSLPLPWSITSSAPNTYLHIMLPSMVYTLSIFFPVSCSLTDHGDWLTSRDSLRYLPWTSKASKLHLTASLSTNDTGSPLKMEKVCRSAEGRPITSLKSVSAPINSFLTSVSYLSFASYFAICFLFHFGIFFCAWGPLKF